MHHIWWHHRASYTIWNLASIIPRSTWMVARKCGVVPLVDLAWPMMVGTTSYAKFSNSIELKLINDFNKLGMAHMVVKTSHTSMLRSTNCPPPSSNSIGVKNSQVLTHVIVAYTTIWCLASISSRSSLSLLEELESRLGATKSINNKLGARMK